MLLKLKKYTIVVLVVSLVVIVLQNTQAVTVQLLFWKISMSRVFLYPLIFLIGALVGFLAAKLQPNKDEIPVNKPYA